MAKEWAKSFYQSKSWIDCRKAYKSSRFGLCERCQKPDAEIVHHKIYINQNNIHNPEITLDWGNLELLCKACHNREHFEKHSATREVLVFNELGELIQRPPVFEN